MSRVVPACGDDGRVAADQGVEQAGLAGVGRADQGDAIALAHPLAALRVGQGRVELARNSGRQARRRASRDLGRQVLVGEIHRRLEQGQGLDQPSRQAA